MEEGNEVAGQINALKQLLVQTDYQALKFSDGAMAEDEYAPVRQRRAEWRAKINELEAQATA